MAVSDTDVGQIYTGNGATTSFAIVFDYAATSEIHVFAIVIATGVIEEKVLTTDYTISGSNVVMNTAPAATRYLVVERVTARTQAYDFTNNTAPFSESLEGGLDALVRQIQELDDKLDRVPFGDRRPDLSGFDLRIPPDFFTTAGATLVNNDDADGFDVGPTADDIENAVVYAANAAASAVAAAASAAAAAASVVTAAASSAAAGVSAAAAAASALAAAASEAAALATVNQIFGTYGAPVPVLNANGFRASESNFSTTAYEQTIFFEPENAGVNTIAATPILSNHTVTGAVVRLVCDGGGGNSLLIDASTANMELKGDWFAENSGDTLTVMWGGTGYFELSRNN